MPPLQLLPAITCRNPAENRKDWDWPRPPPVEGQDRFCDPGLVVGMLNSPSGSSGRHVSLLSGTAHNLSHRVGATWWACDTRTRTTRPCVWHLASRLTPRGSGHAAETIMPVLPQGPSRSSRGQCFPSGLPPSNPYDRAFRWRATNSCNSSMPRAPLPTTPHVFFFLFGNCCCVPVGKSSPEHGLQPLCYVPKEARLMDPFAKPTLVSNTEEHRLQILETVRILPFAKHIITSQEVRGGGEAGSQDMLREWNKPSEGF